MKLIFAALALTLTILAPQAHAMNVPFFTGCNDIRNFDSVTGKPAAQVTPAEIADHGCVSTYASYVVNDVKFDTRRGNTLILTLTPTDGGTPVLMKVQFSSLARAQQAKAGLDAGVVHDLILDPRRDLDVEDFIETDVSSRTLVLPGSALVGVMTDVNNLNTIKPD